MSSETESVVPYCLLAAAAGVSCGAGYNIMSYAVFIAHKRGTELTNCQNFMFSLANVLLSLFGIGLFLIASRHGPVSVVMPLQIASTLFLNMSVQAGVGIKQYSKPMIIGTLVLCAAATCLMEVGPADAPGDIPILDLLSAPAALLWLVSMVATLIAAAVVLYVSNEEDKMMVLVAYAVLVADSTALGATIGKVLVILSATGHPMFFLAFLFYVFMGFGSLGGGLFAARACDMAIYLPMTECVQLAINGVTGLVVWGDGQRLTTPVAYAMVYVLILLGVYMCAEEDKVTPRAEKQLMKAVQSAATSFTGAVQGNKSGERHSSVRSGSAMQLVATSRGGLSSGGGFPDGGNCATNIRLSDTTAIGSAPSERFVVFSTPSEALSIVGSAGGIVNDAPSAP